MFVQQNSYKELLIIKRIQYVKYNKICEYFKKIKNQTFVGKANIL